MSDWSRHQVALALSRHQVEECPPVPYGTSVCEVNNRLIREAQSNVFDFNLPFTVIPSGNLPYTVIPPGYDPSLAYEEVRTARVDELWKDVWLFGRAASFPPLAFLAMGIAGAWIIRGFRSDANHNFRQ